MAFSEVSGNDIRLIEYTPIGCNDEVSYFSQTRFKPLKEDDNYAAETLKDIRILQLEEENKELRELTKLQPLKSERSC